MSDWQRDPELKKLREELIASFPERKTELDAGVADFEKSLADGDAEAAEKAFLNVVVVVHKLAGAASSYGLTALGSVAVALDDLLAAELAVSVSGQRPVRKKLAERVDVLSRALAEAFAARGDAPEAAASPEGKKLISDAGRLP
jgi:HPt (histidine-containing phosphotransfer) domain-containing protein